MAEIGFIGVGNMGAPMAENLVKAGHAGTAFDVAPAWRRRIPEVVHVDGTARAQVVTRAANGRYYALLERLGELTGAPVALNTSLNRRGEPIACTPDDALDVFEGSDLRHLVMEDLLVTKRGTP